MIRHLVTALGFVAASFTVSPAIAQTAPDTLIVLDGSGSMWGQIDGRTKIDIARETLSSVLSEVSPSMNIGMIAYGHRVRGQCSDIETLVPMGPAGQTVPRMIDAANRISPRGMTPLSDAVRKAAEEMLYTERAATVVLITDGIETCDADPCALGRELEAAGIDFTAHVVGFGLTGDEGRQVACLAENTGGRYVPAGDADQLVDALRDTIMADENDFVEEEEDFVEEEPAPPARRRVEFTFRDAADGPKLQVNELHIVIEPRGEAAYDEWLGWRHERDYTAEGMFDPGVYDVIVIREKDRATLRARFEIEVPEGGDTLVVDRAIAARLKVNTLVHAGQRIEHGKGVRTANKRGTGYGVYELVPVSGGVADEGARIGFAYRADLDIAIGPGDYVLRGTFARSITREKLISIAPGETKEIDFDFELARVWVEFRDAGGFPAARPYTRASDKPAGSAFFASGRDVMNNEKLPWYLPVGSWRLETGHEGSGGKRAQLVVTVARPGEEITLSPTEGQRLSDADIARMSDGGRTGCLGFGGTEHGRNACIVEKVEFSAGLQPGSDEVSIDGQPNPYANEDTGTSAPLPPGIYGLVERAGFDLANGADISEAVAICAMSPFVAYPDGYVQSKVRSPVADATGIPYRTSIIGQCKAIDGGASCRMWQPEAPDSVQTREFSVTPAADGHVRLVNRTRGNQEGMLYACVRQGGEMSATETLPDGRRAIDHIMSRADGGPELSYSDSGEYLGSRAVEARPPSPAPEPGGDFGAIAGLYGRLGSSGEPKQGDDLLDACYYNGLVLYAGGFAQGFRENISAETREGTTTPPVASMHMMCRGTAQVAACDARQGAYPDGAPVPAPIQLASKPGDMIELCVSGDCFSMQQCRDPRAAFAGDLPAPDGRHWLDHILTRPDGGPGLERAGRP
ncbi:VWA domain-containing protein [Aquibium carbonis]|uniref:VWA domain-containing protein n=1 Tax=Aquibium carbonis TaxID=2495581 RepID=A0A3R9YEC2_9HYPH|nr:VWA domain-containing protein [Aquibium carbonis]RST85702.1 VWA domain-containing protein [Aquibium carbonis]